MSVPPALDQGRPRLNRSDAARPAVGAMVPPSERVRVRRSFVLLAFAFFVPGAAQFVVGDRRIGRVAIRIWAGVVVAGLLAAGSLLISRTLLLSVVTHPWFLRLLAVALFAGCVAWPLLVFDTWRLTGPRTLPLKVRRWVAILAILMMALTFWLPFAAARRSWAAAGLIGDVFGSNAQSDAVAGRYNVLLLGGDAGKGRVGLRPDSINLASIDAKTGRTVMFSIPRNMENVPFPAGTPAAAALPNGFDCGDECIVNALYTWGTEHRNLFPGAADPGVAAMMQAVEGITGLKVNYYVLVDLKGFQGLIDAMGGIDIDAATKVPIGGGSTKIYGYIQPGKQHMDGYHALWYARSREGSSDYERMQRQRCVMTAMVEQMAPATVLKNFQSIASAGKQVVETSIPTSDLATFVDLGVKAKGQKITSVQFVPPLVVTAHPDFAVVRNAVTTAVAASEKKDDPASSASGAAPAPASSGAASSGSKSSSKPAASSSGSASGSAAGSASGDGAVDVRQVCAAA